MRRRYISIASENSPKLEILCNLLCDEYDVVELREDELIKIEFPSRRLGIKFKNGRLSQTSPEATSLGTVQFFFFLTF